MESLPRVFDMLQYVETILLSVGSLYSSQQDRVYFMGGQALMETCDVTKHGRHLGFYPELEIRSKPWGLVIFCA